ncbi:MAG: RNA-binding protein, partial [Dinoroseobacter sp.]|nr:RNA-binding protein [Dinoroseobacter sp.]
MTRGGQDKDRSNGPERRCIATGEVRPKSQLIRFVVGPDGQIVPDILGRLPGRGIWVSAERSAIETAIKKKAFGRSAKMQVSVPGDLADQVEALVLGRISSLLAMARKAGNAIAGFEKVKGALVTEWAIVLIQASDGSARGKSKLRAPEDGYFI